MTTRTPSRHTNRRNGPVGKRICCFTMTTVKVTTMSLAQPAKKRNPRSLYPTLKRVCVWEFYNEKTLNKKYGQELRCVLKCGRMKFVYVCRGACVPSWLSSSLSEWRCLSYQNEKRVWTGMRLKENASRPLRLSEWKHTAVSLQQNTLSDWLANSWFEMKLTLVIFFFMQMTAVIYEKKSMIYRKKSN